MTSKINIQSDEWIPNPDILLTRSVAHISLHLKTTGRGWDTIINITQSETVQIVTAITYTLTSQRKLTSPMCFPRNQIDAHQVYHTSLLFPVPS